MSIIPAPGTKLGAHSHLSEEIKKYVHIPVATVGRITEAWIAEEIIATGKADAVMMGRANLCDPEFVNKAMDGREEDIRPCIGCLKCLNGIMFGKRVACTMNPSFELENEDTLVEAEVKKNVLVIGGGPSGMEAAFVAKKRGHYVVLCEKQGELGGLLRAASVPIGKQDLCRVIQFMAHRVEKAGVEIRLNTEVTADMLTGEFAGYEVIACNGAKPVVIDKFTGFKQWMTADDILNGRAFPGRKIVIIGGGSVGCETADYLAPTVNDRFPRNRDITVIEMADEIMMKEAGVPRSVLVQRMVKKGVHIITKAAVDTVENDKIYYTTEGVQKVIGDADTLVFATGYKVCPAMEDMLREAGVTYHMVGDAAAVGTIKEAISTGYEVAKAL